MTRGDLLITLTKISQGDHEAVHTAKNHDASQRALIEQQAKQIAFHVSRVDALRRFLIEKISDCQNQAKEIERLNDLNEHIKIEAQGHAQEARTANATIHEIYQCVSGSTGEPGNWHGAQPVREAIDRLTHELTQANEACAALREGKPLGPVIGAQTILNQAKEIDETQTKLKALCCEHGNVLMRLHEQCQEIARLQEALSELHAQVQGECPSLLNDDSGGDAKLALEIEALLKEEHP